MSETTCCTNLGIRRQGHAKDATRETYSVLKKRFIKKRGLSSSPFWGGPLSLHLFCGGGGEWWCRTCWATKHPRGGTQSRGVRPATHSSRRLSGGHASRGTGRARGPRAARSGPAPGSPTGPRPPAASTAAGPPHAGAARTAAAACTPPQQGSSLGRSNYLPERKGRCIRQYDNHLCMVLTWVPSMLTF